MGQNDQTDPRQLLVKVVEVLDRFSIPYLITGGIAVFVWGRPRFTADVDIVIALNENDIKKLADALKNISEFGYVEEEAMLQAFERGGEFNFIDGTTGVKVDFWILQDSEFDRSRMKRRVAQEILGEKVYFTSPEDLILIKLLWYKQNESSRHLEDAESILKISGDKLERDYLKKWADNLGVEKELQNLRQKVYTKCHGK